MKIEVGKKYRISGSDKPWEVVAIDIASVAVWFVASFVRLEF
jgi:hypothetical protein